MSFKSRVELETRLSEIEKRISVIETILAAKQEEMIPVEHPIPAVFKRGPGRPRKFEVGGGL